MQTIETFFLKCYTFREYCTIFIVRVNLRLLVYLSQEIDFLLLKCCFEALKCDIVKCSNISKIISISILKIRIYMIYISL